MTLEKRIEDLETQLHLMRRRETRMRSLGLIVIAVAGGSLALAAFKPAQEKVLRAESFEVVVGGKVRARMTADSDGGLLQVFNKNDKGVAALSVDANGGMLRIFHANGKRVVDAASAPDGGWLRVYDKLGTSAAAFVATPEGGSVGIQNKDGKPVAGMWTDPAGGSLRLSTPTGGLRFKAP